MTSFTSCQLSRWSFNVVQTTSKSDLGDRISDVSWECPHLYLEQTTCDQINQDACRYQVWTACYSDKILPLSHSNLILIVLQRNNSANCWSVSDTKEISNEATIRRTRSQIMWWVQQMLCLKPVLSQKAFYIEFCHCSVFIIHLKWVLIVPKVLQPKTVRSYFQALLQCFISFLTQGRLSDCIRSSSSIWDCLPGVQRQAQRSSCVLFIRVGGLNKTDGLPNQPVSTYHEFSLVELKKYSSG